MLKISNASVWRKQRGIVAVLAAVMLPMMMAIAGLVMDVGLLYKHKRDMQTGADAAAFAAAHTLKRKDYGNVTAYALQDATRNGFDGSAGQTRTVNRPPLTGDFVGDSDFVEVILTESVPTYFMRLFGWSTANVSVRAVGGA